ncbi:MAG: class 1 fructose-bisphosphatase [Acidobacteriota bacterium]
MGANIRHAGPPTLTQFILERERSFIEATGDFTSLMSGIALSAKLISREVNKAGLVDILGLTGRRNVQGEAVQKLDDFAHHTVVHSLERTGTVCVMGSEEAEGPIPVHNPHDCGKYVVVFDPLDGSSNIDVGAPIGTIFSVLHRLGGTGPGRVEDLLQRGSEQVAAGYVIYGSSTMFIYSTGQGVHAFTLDPSLGEFLLSSEAMIIPEPSRIYSINEAHAATWEEPVRQWLHALKAAGSHTARYIGSLVADFHRNLLRGGIFAYPADITRPEGPRGKLRLLYEAAPLAFLAEQAGGGATDGRRRILDIVPQDLHQRTPLFIGNRTAVAEVTDSHTGRQTDCG